MTASAEADRGHPGGARRSDPRRAVLDDETVIRRRREPLGGIKEQIGSRLTARDHRRGEQVFAKTP